MFDAPSVEECYRRPETIVPQQALALTNSGMALARAAEIASAIGREVGDGDSPASRSAFVGLAFERLLGRAPTEPERGECERALERLLGVYRAEARPGPAPHLRARAGPTICHRRGAQAQAIPAATHAEHTKAGRTAEH